MKSSPNCPILDFQPGDSGEFHHVSSDQREIMHQRDCCDLQIHWPDDTTPSLQIVPNHSILIRTWIVERKRDRHVQCPDNILFPGNRIVIFFRPVHEFRADWRAYHYFSREGTSKFFDQSKILSLENFDPDIGIEEISHHQVFAGDNGSSGGSSNSRSAQHPMISARSGRLRLISSSVGGFCGATADEIASRTRVSNACAVSRSKRSKTRSSSKAIPLTRKRYDLSHSTSIHNL